MSPVLSMNKQARCGWELTPKYFRYLVGIALMNRMRSVWNKPKGDVFFKCLGFGVFCYALFVAVFYAWQLPLEQYSFRQTQTALSAFWLARDGFSFAYETPVVGAPWSIPFEFPLYQYLVAVIANATGVELVAVGRLLSFAFLLGCLWPINSICKMTGVSRTGFYVFVALLFSSPIYLFWGRTFMMETAAVFFAVMAIKYFLVFVQGAQLKAAFFFIVFIGLSVLQKATTGLPVLAVLAFVYLFCEIAKAPKFYNVITLKNVGWALVLFGVPLLVGAAWTHYTDIVKSNNPFGTQITSSALTAWNWGSLSQRFDYSFYRIVFWDRIFSQNLAGLFGLSIILAGLIFAVNKLIRRVIFVSIVLAIAPLLIFSNLHLIHLYYQSANVIFFIFALAVALTDGLLGARSKPLLGAVLCGLLGSNYLMFWHGYYQDITRVYDANNLDVAVAAALKKGVPEKDAFMAYGLDWSSTLSFLAERKSFTVPDWFKEYSHVIETPEKYLGGKSLGAVVLCQGSGGPTPRKLIELSNLRGWQAGKVVGCYITMPANTLRLDTVQRINTTCEGALDSVSFDSSLADYVEIKGWATLPGKPVSAPEHIFVTMTAPSGQMKIYESVQFPRGDVNDYLKSPKLGNAGYSRLINMSGKSGRYMIGIARLNKNVLEFCQFQKELDVRAAAVN